MTESKKDVLDLVKAALRSDKNLELYKPKFTDKIKASDKTYITCTIDTIKKVLKDKKEDGFTKLFALFLLKEVMDTKNPDLVAYVHKKILRRLGEIAKGKQASYFPKDTSPTLIDSFTQLLIECIMVWNDWFGVDKYKRPTKYWDVYNSLVGKVAFPKKKTYFQDDKPQAREQREDPDVGSRSGAQSDIKSSTRPKNIDLEASRGAPSDEIGSSQPPRKPIEVKPETKEDNFLPNLNKTLKKIEEQKEMLLEAMLNEEPDIPGIVQLLQDMKAGNKELLTATNELVKRDFPEKDKVVDQVISDSDLITNLIAEYQKCHKKETTFEEYQQWVIDTLCADLKIDPKDLYELEPDDAQKMINLEQPGKGEKMEVEPPKAVRKESDNANKGKTSQKPSPKLAPTDNKPKNEGFDYDAFESPEDEGVNQRNQQLPPPRKEVIQPPPKKEVPKETPKTLKVDPNETSQYSEGGTKKPARSFQDLFTSAPGESRGRKMTRDKNDSSKGSIKFGASWDTKPQDPKGRNPQTGQKQGQGQGLGFEDFDDMPAHDPTNTYEDSSAISESGMYNFNYAGDQSKSKSKERSTMQSGERKTAEMWSPPQNVLGGFDEFGIRGNRKVSPTAQKQADFEREQEERYQREQEQARYEREQREKYEREEQEREQEEYRRAQEEMRRKQEAAEARNRANNNVQQQQQQAARSTKTDSNQGSRGGSYRIEVKKPPQDNRPKDNFGFGNPFGQEEEGQEEPENEFGFSGGFGQSRDSSKNILIQGNEPQQQYSQKGAAPQNTQSTQKQAQAQAQAQAQNRSRPVSQGNTSDFQPILTSTLGANPMNTSTMSPSQRSRFPPIERPSFLGKFDTFQTLNMTSFSEGPAMKQADELLERARKLTQQKLPTVMERPSFLASPPPQLTLNDPYRRDEPFKRDSHINPPLSFAEPIGTVPLYLNAERIDPFRTSTLPPQGLGGSIQGSSGEGGLLRELERARDMSRAIAQQYASPSKRSLSEGPMRLSGIHQPSKYLPTETHSPARGDASLLAFAQPSKYLERESPLKREPELKRSIVFTSPKPDDSSAKIKELKSSYFERKHQTPTKIDTEREERKSRVLTTVAASESKEFARAMELIEKAKRMREESVQRNWKKESQYSKNDNSGLSLLRSPKTEARANDNNPSMRNSRVDGGILRESSYMTRERPERQYQHHDEGLRKSRVEFADQRPIIMEEEERFRQSLNSAVTFNGVQNNFQRPLQGHVHNSMHEASTVNLTRVPEIRSYDMQMQPTLPQETRVNRYEREVRKSPTRLVGPDGKVYEEVVNGIGRKPLHNEEPRLIERQPLNNGYRESPVMGGVDPRGRSRETKYETMGQLRDPRPVTRSPPRFQQLYGAPSEGVELHSGQTIRIIERPVPGSEKKRNRSTMRESSRDSSRREREVEQKLPQRVVGNRIPPTTQQQPKGQIGSHKLAAEIKNEIEQLKRSMVVKKSDDSKQASATSNGTNGTLDLETFPLRQQQQQIQQPQALPVRRYEETKVDTAVRVNGVKETGVPGVRIDTRDQEEILNAERRRGYEKEVREVQERAYIRAVPRDSDLSMPITPAEPEEDSRNYGSGRRLDVREISGIKGVKVVMDNSDMWEEESTLRTRNEDSSIRKDYKVLGVNKPKQGRFVSFDYYLFDQIANTILSNGQGKDLDGYKSACLLNKAVLFESARLKVDVITRLEDENGNEDKTLKMILHYGNKANQSITNFVVDILERGIERNPQINGASLAPRYQLKQELFLDFFNFKNAVYTVQISYQYEGIPYGVNLPLPLSINKFMKLNYVSSSEYKKQWKALKSNAIKSRYKHINAKFIRDPTEINKYFNNSLIDVTPSLNPKRKRKYGGVFVLPDKREYYLRISMDASRVKFIVSAGPYSQQQFSEWAVQYLSFLLTV